MRFIGFIERPHEQNMPQDIGFACIGNVPPEQVGVQGMWFEADDITQLLTNEIVILGEVNGVLEVADVDTLEVSQEYQDRLRLWLSEYTQLPQAVINNMNLTNAFEVITRVAVHFGYPPGQMFNELAERA